MALPDDEHRLIFANSIARRAGVPLEGINVNHVIDTLSALWAYEYERLTNAAAETDYNPHGHENDVYDAQQLIYLAHPELHFLTCDRGFAMPLDRRNTRVSIGSLFTSSRIRLRRHASFKT